MPKHLIIWWQPSVPLYQKKDNVVYLKTGSQNKLLLMCTIIVCALRRFEVTGPCHFPHIHIWTSSSPPPSPLAWQLVLTCRIRKEEAGSQNHTCIVSNSPLQLHGEWQMKGNEKQEKKKFGLILTWQKGKTKKVLKKSMWIFRGKWFLCL